MYVFVILTLVFGFGQGKKDLPVQYYLYAKSVGSVELMPNTYNKLNVEYLTKFIVHGYYESAQKTWYENLTNEYLKKGNYNIVQVDWSRLASGAYSVSAQNTEVVGYLVGDLISALHTFHGLSLSKVHLIGHSLGAHVCGYAGKKINSLLNKKVARITALDAARPLFESPSFLKGLVKDDGEVVDAIHTDGGLFGRKDSIGTVDFYPNGGVSFQPGCSVKQILTPSKSVSEMVDKVFCSHQKSYYYFINSINKVRYEGYKCNSWISFQRNECQNNAVAVMGDDYTYTPELTGNFYLIINNL